ncbi:uncharacterized protein [Eurosta solidaginis]|uniref:uncharacterized protein n=1 Tax=Eurosta solidaginis TaxID=178769 RepID=UPI0035312C6F
MPTDDDTNDTSVELPPLRQQRSSMKRNITNLKTKIEREGATADATILECQLQILESYFKQVCHIQTQIEKLCFTDNGRSDLEELFITTKSKLLGFLNKARRSSSAELSYFNTTTPSLSSHRLPKLKLPKFDGKYTEYSRFIHTFESLVHADSSLSQIDKFNYLLDCLSGAARAVIEPFDVTEANYQRALQRLKERFDNKTLIFIEHIKILHTLPSMNKGDHIALRSLIDNVASIKGALLSIGSEKDIMEALLIDIILTRLDADSKKAYDERQEFKELPSFEKCYTNLSHRCQLLESWNKRSPDVANHIPNSKDACGIFQPVRALLDSCSELNFITLETAKRLRLHQIRFNQEVAGIAGASERVSTKVETTIQSRFSNFNCTAEFAVVNTISSRQPSQYIDTKSLEFPPNVNLADPYFFKPHKIDLLIGTDIFFELLDEGKLSLDGNQCLIVNTLLGWIVGGKYENHSTLQSNACYFTKSLSSPDLSAQLQRFWEIEEYKQEQQLSEEHVACEAHYVKNVTYTADNRVQVSLPFIGSPKALGNSFQNAYRRFISLERRFKRDSELGKSYTEFMKEYAALGHMSPISEVDISPNHYFIPHHAVLRPTNVTTKLRVVFDVSQKTSSNVSLNDLLMVGPTIQPDLITTLLKFRLYKHALTADICKMYRQFGMSPKDRQFQLIVWRDEPHLPLQFYELNTITYGTASAPFLAIRSLFFIAETYGNLYPLGAHVLKSDLYVDDVLTGADTLEELKQRKFELTQLLAMAKLELAKWNSNCIELFTNSDEVAIQLASGVTSTLGMLWKPRSDQFCFQFNDEPHRNTTKRLILSKTAKIYDLLGLLSPIVVRCKMLLQALWLHGASWDEEVPKPLSDLWASIEDDLPKINTISVPRYAFTSPSQRGELHGFSDASERAYGCCIYTRIWHNVKAQSVPRLELCAALLLIRTWKKFEVNLKQNINTVYFWTDSTTSFSG